MPNELQIESAKSGGKVIGYRLTIYPSANVLLVFANQETLSGYRCGNRFHASPGEVIEYATVNVLPMGE